MDNHNESRADRVLRYLARLEDGILIALLSTMIFLAVLQIVLRNVFQSGYTDGDSLVRILVLWVGMFGAVVASRERKHISIDVLSRYFSERVQHIVGIVIDIFVIVVCSLLAFHSARMMMEDYEAGSLAFSTVPTWLMESVLPFAFSMIALRYLMFAWNNIKALRHGGPQT